MYIIREKSVTESAINIFVLSIWDRRMRWQDTESYDDLQKKFQLSHNKTAAIFLKYTPHQGGLKSL